MITHLVRQSIVELVYQRTVLFLIIVTSFAISVFGVLFYSGYFSYSYYDWLNGEVCRVDLSLQESSSDIVANILSSVTGLSEEAVISIVVSDGSISNNYVHGNTVPIIGKYNKLESEQVLLGRYFSVNENDPVVLLSESYAAILDIQDAPIGMIIRHDQNDFLLVGILFNAEYAYILPIDYYVEHFPVKKISVLFNENVDRTKMKDIAKTFDETISDYTYAKRPSPFLSRSFLPSLMQILLVYIFTLINILLVILLWQKNCQTRYMIYSICGLHDRHLYTLVVLQVTLVSTIGIITGFLAYLIMLPFFEALSIVKAKISDYLIIVGVVVILIVIFSSIYSRRTIRNLAVYVSKE